MTTNASKLNVDSSSALIPGQESDGNLLDLGESGSPSHARIQINPIEEEDAKSSDSEGDRVFDNSDGSKGESKG